MTLASVDQEDLVERLRRSLEHEFKLSNADLSRLVALLRDLRLMSAGHESASEEMDVSRIGIDSATTILNEDLNLLEERKRILTLTETTIQPILYEFDFFGSTGYSNQTCLCALSPGTDIAGTVLASLAVPTQFTTRRLKFQASQLTFVGLDIGNKGPTATAPNIINAINSNLIQSLDGIVLTRGEPFTAKLSVTMLQNGLRPTKTYTPTYQMDPSTLLLSTTPLNGTTILQLYRQAFNFPNETMWDPQFTRPMLIYVALMITLANNQLDYTTKTKKISYSIIQGDNQIENILINARELDEYGTLPFSSAPNQQMRLSQLIERLNLHRQGIVESDANASLIADDDAQLSIELGDYFSSMTRLHYYNHIHRLSQFTPQQLMSYFRIESWATKRINIYAMRQGFESIMPYSYTRPKLILWKSAVLYGLLMEPDHFISVMTNLQTAFESMTIMEFSNKNALQPLSSLVGGSTTETEPFLQTFANKLSSHNKRTNDLHWLLSGWLYNGLGAISCDFFQYQLERNMDGVVQLISAVYILPLLTDHFALAKVVQMMANWEHGVGTIQYSRNSNMTMTSAPNDITTYEDIPLMLRVPPGQVNNLLPRWIRRFYEIAYESFGDESITFRKDNCEQFPSWNYFSNNENECLTLRYGRDVDGLFPSWPGLNNDAYGRYITNVGEWITNFLPDVIRRFLPSLNARNSNINRLPSVFTTALYNFRVYLDNFYSYEMRMIAALSRLPILQRPIWRRLGQHADAAGIDVQAYNSSYRCVRQNEDQNFVTLSYDVNSNAYYIDGVSCFYAMCILAPRKGQNDVINPRDWYTSNESFKDFMPQILRRAGQILNYNQYYQLLLTAINVYNINADVNNWACLNPYIEIPIPNLSQGDKKMIYTSFANLIASGFKMQYQPFDTLFATYSFENPVLTIRRLPPFEVAGAQIEEYELPIPAFDDIDISFYFNLAHLANNSSLLNMCGNRIQLKFGNFNDVNPQDPLTTPAPAIPNNSVAITRLDLTLTNSGLLINGQEPGPEGSIYHVELTTLGRFKDCLSSFTVLATRLKYTVFLISDGHFIGQVSDYSSSFSAVQDLISSITSNNQVGIVTIPLPPYAIPGPNYVNVQAAEQMYNFPIFTSNTFARSAIIQNPSLNRNVHFTFEHDLDGQECFQDMIGNNDILTIPDFLNRMEEPDSYNVLARARPQLVSYRLRKNVVGAVLVSTEAFN